MEAGLALLIALGIFIGIPTAIGFAVVGGVARRERARLAHRPKVRWVVRKTA